MKASPTATEVLERRPLPGGGLELWARAGVAYVGPVIRPTYSARLRAALERRRDASLSGQCVCGGAIAGGGPLTPGVGAVTIAHEEGCDAIEETVHELLAAEGGR